MQYVEKNIDSNYQVVTTIIKYDDHEIVNHEQLSNRQVMFNSGQLDFENEIFLEPKSTLSNASVCKETNVQQYKQA